MQGFSLAKPIKIGSKASLPKYHRKQVLEFIGRKPSSWMYGHVDAVCLPSSLIGIHKQPIQNLNRESNGTRWIDKETVSVPDMPFGRGSIGNHTDDMTGLTLLILLYCEPWVAKNRHPEYNGHNGEFISGDKVIEMEVGDAIVFDDRVPHAWLTNSAWAFAVFPLIAAKI